MMIHIRRHLFAPKPLSFLACHMRVQDKRSGIHVVVHCGRVPSLPVVFDVFVLCFAGQSPRGRDKRHWLRPSALNSIRVRHKGFQLT